MQKTKNAKKKKKKKKKKTRKPVLVKQIKQGLCTWFNN
jgi:hypothetical protein